jgi:hypothetical protein
MFLSRRVSVVVVLHVLSCLAVGRTAATAASGLPREFGTDGGPPPKHAAVVPWMPPAIPLVLGDGPSQPFPIAALPFSASGSTCGYLDDVPFPCGDATSTPSPDVFYRFTPATDGCVDVSLCGSDFDTGLSVREVASGTLVGCNDDYCGLQSRISGLAVRAGVAYDIVVDAYSGCGNYVLTVDESACAGPCKPLECPAGAIAENEPDCADYYVDTFNAGCNGPPFVYTPLTCPVVVCGRYGKFYAWDAFPQSTVTRDTDWYRLDLTTAQVLHVCVQGEANTQLDVIDANGGCTLAAMPGGRAFVPACDTYCVDVAVGTGTYLVLVAPMQDETMPACGSRYVLSVSGSECGSVPARRGSWGRLKSLYR